MVASASAASSALVAAPVTAPIATPAAGDAWSPLESRRQRAGVAGWLLHSALSERVGMAPGQPTAEAALQTAAAGAAEFLGRLALLHSLDEADGWAPDAYRRLFLEEAVAAWCPGTRVTEDGPRLRVVKPGCPLAAACAADARVCAMCQVFHEVVARLMMPGAVERVAFEELAPQRGRCVIQVVRTATTG